jgi:polyferredoxin
MKSEEQRLKRITWSRVSQIIFLIVFLYLFVTTEYRGKDEISVAINSFFRADPLVAISYILSEKAIVGLIVPGLLMVLFTAILGRFFCGWICPLGTTIDLITSSIRKKAPIQFIKGRFKYWLLLPLLTAALFNVNLTGILDPIAILVRALTFFLYPLLGYTVRSGWAGLYSLMGDSSDYVRPVYGFLKAYVLPFRETLYPLAFVSFGFFLFILFLERYERRNWCRNLCPLGTLLGILGKYSLFKRLPGRLCSDCQNCKDICPTTFDQEVLQKQDCILCMECEAKCKFRRAKFSLRSFKGKSKKTVTVTPPLVSRRVFVGTVLSGFFLSRVFSFQPPSSQERLLRPPGANDEGTFLKKCVRCGECMKVCLKNALYPDYFRAGLYGLYMPVVIPRLGYCEYNCNLCGQVCPTGAIPNQPLEKKKKSIIGLAAFDKNHCLPYAKKINCIVCEEHCPIPEKAIRLETVEEKDYEGRTISLKRPYVVDELCNGCGICEFVCPLEGKSAIEVYGKTKRKKV